MISWTRQVAPDFYVGEVDATKRDPNSYEPWEPEDQYKGTLWGDRIFRRSLLAAFLLAFFAGSGFGLAHLLDDPIAVALGAFIALSVGMAHGGRALFIAGSHGAPRRTHWGLGLGVGLMILVPEALRGSFDLEVSTFVAGGVILYGLANQGPVLRWIFLVMMVFGGPAFLPWYLQADELVPRLVFAGMAFVTCVSLFCVHRSNKIPMSPAAMIIAVALLALALLPFRTRPLDAWVALPGILVALLLLIFIGGARWGWLWGAALGVGLVHLWGMLIDPGTLYGGMELQLGAASIEFLLIIAAAARRERAKVALLAPGTYIQSPTCLVPLFTTAQSFPVETDVLKD